jgi:hypothetical protein
LQEVEVEVEVEEILQQLLMGGEEVREAHQLERQDSFLQLQVPPQGEVEEHNLLEVRLVLMVMELQLIRLLVLL